MLIQPHISVCMATYNGEYYIEEQIQSIIKQIGLNDELIISDDGSIDNTIKIIKNFQDNRIKLYTHTGSGRPTENFQNALVRAKGKFIFLSDQDDVWLDKKYEVIIKLLESYDLVLSDSILVNEKLEILSPSFFKFHGSAKGILRNIIKNSYFGSCMAFKRELLEYALPFPLSKEVGHDVWIGLVAEMVGKVYFVEKQLILYRRHSAAVTSHGIGKSKRNLIVKLLGRVVMFKYVLLFYLKYLLSGKRVSIHHNTHV